MSRVSLFILRGHHHPPPGIAPAIPIPPADFQKFTKIPIQIIYGDNIPAQPNNPYPGLNFWANSVQAANAFMATINAMGGNAQVVMLPDKGLHGNTHFAFSDLNNVQVADLLSAFLKQNNLDRR